MVRHGAVSVGSGDVDTDGSYEGSFVKRFHGMLCDDQRGAASALNVGHFGSVRTVHSRLSFVCPYSLLKVILFLSVQYAQSHLVSIRAVYSKSSGFCPYSLHKVTFSVHFVQRHVVSVRTVYSVILFLSMQFAQSRLVSVCAVGSKSYWFCPYSLLKVILFVSVQFTQSHLDSVRSVYSKASCFCPYSLLKVILVLSVQYTQSHLGSVRVVYTKSS